MVEQRRAAESAADQGKSLWHRGEVVFFWGGKVAFTGWVANIKLFAYSLNHSTVAVKGGILFLNPVPRALFCKMANTVPLVFCI